MKFNLNNSNGFSRVLVGTAILATLGVMVPEVAQASSNENHENLTVSAGNKQTATAVYNTGQEAMRSQNYQQAIANFDQAIAANPQHAEAYRDRGSVHERMGDYVKARSDWQKAASLFRQREDIVSVFHIIQQLSKLEKTFACRQNNGQWETVMNRNSQTYPLIVWHDRRVMDINRDGTAKVSADPLLGQIPDHEDIRLIPQNRSSDSRDGAIHVDGYTRQVRTFYEGRHSVTTTVAGNQGGISAEHRCVAVSQRLENLSNLIFDEGADNLFRVATLERNYSGVSLDTGRTEEFKNNTQVACISGSTTGCDETNAIFTLSGQSNDRAEEENIIINETNEQRLARFVRLIDNPGLGDPIHN